MTATRMRKPIHKRAWLWLPVLLLGLYALLGFAGLPWYLAGALPERLERHLGWQATVADVTANPFTLSVTIAGLEAKDAGGDEVLALDRLHLNLGFWSLFRGLLDIDVLAADEPFLRLDLLAEGGVNLVRDWRRNNPAPAADSGDSGDGGLLSVYLGRLALDGGELYIRDFSQPEYGEFRVTPLDFELENLASFPREGQSSDYRVAGALGEQTLHWEGDLSVAPFHSQGRLELGAVDHATIAHFTRRWLPWQLTAGRAAVSTSYELSGTRRGFALQTSNGRLRVEDLTLVASTDNDTDSAPLITANAIDIHDIGFVLGRRELALGQVLVDGLDVGAERNADGGINLVEPFTGTESDAGENGDNKAAGLRWSVAGVELSRSRLRWQDAATAKPVGLALTDLELELGTLSDRLEEPVSYDLSMRLDTGGQASARGQFTIRPFTLEAGLSAAEVGLPPFQGYLNEFTRLTVGSGNLSLDGNLDLDQQDDPLTGTFSGRGTVSDFSAGLPDSSQAMVSWQQLRLDPIEYNLAPARLELGTVTVTAPVVNAIRVPEAGLNLTRILRDSAGADDASDEATDEVAGDDSTPAFIFRISEVTLENGQLNYTDRTLEPRFATELDRLTGSVTGLSNVPPQHGRLVLQGRVDDSGELRVEGSIGTLGTEDVTELDLTLKGLSMPVLGPYFGRYLGYGVDAGKLALDLDYTFRGTQVEARNQVIMQRLRLGGPVQSDMATDAPVRLGLALLRDGDGNIEINLPVSGDLTDPDFQLGPVVMRTFVGLLGKAATSPFSLLGSLADLAGLSGEELGQVAFIPGEATLVAGEQDKLEALADALEQRPELVLSVRGAAAPELDREALLRRQLFEDLGIDPRASLDQRLAFLRRAWEARGEDVSQLRRQLADNGAGSVADSALEQALVARLGASVSIATDALNNLARARGQLLRRQLRETHGVPGEQLFTQSPDMDARTDNSEAVIATFSLEAR